MLLGTGGLGALALVAFLAFVVAGLIWLVVTLQQADPAVTRRTTAMVALVSGAVLIAVLLAQVLFFPRSARGVAQSRVGQDLPGLMRPPLPGMMGGQGFPGRLAPAQPPAPGAPQVRPRQLRPTPPAPAPTARPTATP